MGQYHHPVCTEAEEGIYPSSLRLGFKEGEQGFSRPGTPNAILALVCARNGRPPKRSSKEEPTSAAKPSNISLPLATTSLCAPSTTVDGAPGVSGAFRSLGDTLVAKDVELEFHGTINLLRPLSPQAASWIDENIADEAQWFGTALAVEPRYCPDIVAGMIDDGLAVYIGENLVDRRLLAAPPLPTNVGGARGAEPSGIATQRNSASIRRGADAVYVGVLTPGEPRRSSHQHGSLTLIDHR